MKKSEGPLEPLPEPLLQVHSDPHLGSAVTIGSLELPADNEEDPLPQGQVFHSWLQRPSLRT